jgi:hypothetical protein
MGGSAVAGPLLFLVFGAVFFFVVEGCFCWGFCENRLLFVVILW